MGLKTNKDGKAVYSYLGKEYNLDHAEIVVDFITKTHLHIGEAFLKAGSKIVISAEEGYLDTIEYAYTKVNPIVFTDHCYILKTKHGSINILKDVLVEGNGAIYDVDLGDGYVLDTYTFLQYSKKLNPNKFRSFNNLVKAFNDFDNTNLLQEDKKLLLERDIEFGVRSLTNKIFEGIQYTYGVELETSSGRINAEEAIGLNLKCEFDGSLRDFPEQKKEEVLGGEYITGVLTGDAGMYQLQKICNILSKKCTINHRCGVHVHVGNINLNKETIVYLYLLGLILEGEIYSILPKSRSKNAYCRTLSPIHITSYGLGNSKNPLDYEATINTAYKEIFSIVSQGKEPSKSWNKHKQHPMGAKCGYDKNTQRYCWLNFVTLMFNTKGGGKKSMTLEFRNHSATLNYTKIKNWVKICIAFVNFAENHQSSMRSGSWTDKYGVRHPINLETILLAAYPKTGKTVIEYIESRKQLFTNDTGSIEQEDYDTDKNGIRELSLKEAVCV